MARYNRPEEKSNKVYGIVEYRGKTYTFWGGYHKALAVLHATSMAKYHSKLAKGYEQVSDSDLSKNKDWITDALEIAFAKLNSVG